MFGFGNMPSLQQHMQMSRQPMAQPAPVAPQLPHPTPIAPPIPGSASVQGPASAAPPAASQAPSIAAATSTPPAGADAASAGASGGAGIDDFLDAIMGGA